MVLKLKEIISYFKEYSTPPETKDSFDKLTQADIDRMMNHINSYRRPKLGDKSPFEAFAFHHGTELFEKLGLAQVEPNCVILKPKLLKR